MSRGLASRARADGTRNDLVSTGTIEICILTVAVGEPRIAD